MKALVIIGIDEDPKLAVGISVPENSGGRRMVDASDPDMTADGLPVAVRSPTGPSVTSVGRGMTVGAKVAAATHCQSFVLHGTAPGSQVLKSLHGHTASTNPHGFSAQHPLKPLVSQTKNSSGGVQISILFQWTSRFSETWKRQRTFSALCAMFFVPISLLLVCILFLCASQRSPLSEWV